MAGHAAGTAAGQPAGSGRVAGGAIDPGAAGACIIDFGRNDFFDNATSAAPTKGHDTIDRNSPDDLPEGIRRSTRAMAGGHPPRQNPHCRPSYDPKRDDLGQAASDIPPAGWAREISWEDHGLFGFSDDRYASTNTTECVCWAVTSPEPLNASVDAHPPAIVGVTHTLFPSRIDGRGGVNRRRAPYGTS